jgi:hypothetical protein
VIDLTHWICAMCRSRSVMLELRPAGQATSPTTIDAAPRGRLGRIVYALGLAVSSLRAFARYPSLLVALGLVWVGLAAAGWLARPYVLDLFDSSVLDSQTAFWLTLAAVGVCGFAVVGVVLSFGCLMVLERVRQIEMDEPRRLTGALGNALANTARALPLVLVWSLLWLAVNAVGVLLARDGDHGDDDGDAGDRVLDWSVRAACDAMRMLLFCSLPALAWEVGESPLGAVKRGIAVGRRHKAEFGIGLLLSHLAGAIAVLPVVAVLMGGEYLPEVVWLGAVALSLMLWTFVMLVQQLYAAELYIWYLLWEDASARSVAAGEEPLAPEAIARPSLLDDIPALAAVGGS